MQAALFNLPEYVESVLSVVGLLHLLLLYSVINMHTYQSFTLPMTLLKAIVRGYYCSRPASKRSSITSFEIGNCYARPLAA